MLIKMDGMYAGFSGAKNRSWRTGVQPAFSLAPLRKSKGLDIFLAIGFRSAIRLAPHLVLVIRLVSSWACPVVSVRAAGQS